MPTASTLTIRVLLPLPLGDGYDYLSPDTELSAGTLVEVPLGKRTVFGAVWGAGKHYAADDPKLEKLRPIVRVLELPTLPLPVRTFADWVADYTLSPRGAILKMVLGGQLRLPLKARGKNKEAKADVAVIPPPDPDYLPPQLAGEQIPAAAELVAKVRQRGFSVTLLDGVTGSGKTEVYAEAIAETLRQGRQALLLLPEIAMTAALLNRLAARFGARPVEWHSGLTEKQRRQHWHGIASGQARFVLGARSALFLPYADLGLIVVDEEHETAYKQEEGVIYQGRDMAVVRGRTGNIPVILASATPSLESLQNVESGKYSRVIMRQRFGGAVMPKIELIDLRRETMLPTDFISPPLLTAMQEVLAAGQQSMLFLNRRGYAPLTLCRPCGHRMQCPNCTAWLVEHKRTGRLHCHYCGHVQRVPTICPSCGAEGALSACGPGVERILEEVKRRLPQARTMLAASDTLSGQYAAQAMVGMMDNNELDVIVGTQIIAKGYHFPRLTLVGVVDADAGLYGADLRASERTFQLLQQMSGRSGRGREAGRVLLQTTAPEHPVITAIKCGDRDSFTQAEMRERAAYSLPPFSRMAIITVSGLNAAQVENGIKQLAMTAPQHDGVRVLGPAPAPITVLRGKTRHRLMIRVRRNLDLSELIRRWLAATPPLPYTLRVVVDIDPYNFG